MLYRNVLYWSVSISKCEPLSAHMKDETMKRELLNDNSEATQRRPRHRNAVVPLQERLMWSPREFCALTGLSPATLYRRFADGSIKPFKSAGRTFVTREAAEAWKAGQAGEDAGSIAA